MFVSEELLASEASAIVQLAVGQNTQQSALPRVHIPYDRHPEDKLMESISTEKCVLLH